MGRENGQKKNITISDPNTIIFLDEMRGEHRTWDDTLRGLIKSTRDDRDKLLNHKLREVLDWAIFAYPDRADVPRAIDSFRQILTNDFFLNDPVRMDLIDGKMQCLHRDLIIELRKE